MTSVALMRDSGRAWPSWLSAWLIYIRAMGVFIGVWEVVALVVGNAFILPAPHSVAASLVTLLANGSIGHHVLNSLQRLIVAYAITVSVGFPIGLLMGLSHAGFELIDPVVELLRPISSIAWIPLALAILGVGFVLPVFILVYVSIFPVILNTVAGVRATDPVLVRAARTMGLRRSTIVREIVMPSALPFVLTGIRLSAGLGWMALIASELVGAPSGLGWAIQFYSSVFRTADMVAMIAVVAVLGFATDLFLRFLQRTLTPWATE